MSVRNNLAGVISEKGMRGAVQLGDNWLRAEGQATVDPVYLGEVPLSRETALWAVARAQGVPTPTVVAQGTLSGSGQRYVLTDNLPGVSWNKFMADQDHQLGPYLASMRSLGETVARAHRHQFETYGDAFGASDVRSSVPNFATRLREITARRLANAESKQGAFSDTELAEVTAYFERETAALEPSLNPGTVPSVLAVTNLHNTNFLVHPASGRVTGVPDMKFSQAGPAAIDVYYAMLQQGGYFNQDVLAQARSAFMEGYNKVGNYNPEDGVTTRLEHLLAMSHTLVCVPAYFNADCSDGVPRQTWSGGFKRLLMQGVEEGPDSYGALPIGWTTILRTKTNQPEQPN